jgi:hypothetical protein
MTQRSGGRPASDFRVLVNGLWFEAKVAADYSTGIADELRALAHAPRWFVNEELGFGIGCGPSVLWNAQRAHKDQQARRREIDRERRPPARRRKSSGEWRAILLAAAA